MFSSFLTSAGSILALRRSWLLSQVTAGSVIIVKVVAGALISGGERKYDVDIVISGSPASKAIRLRAGNRIVFQVIWSFLEAMLGYA